MFNTFCTCISGVYFDRTNCVIIYSITCFMDIHKSSHDVSGRERSLVTLVCLSAMDHIEASPFFSLLSCIEWKRSCMRLVLIVMSTIEYDYIGRIRDGGYESGILKKFTFKMIKAVNLNQFKDIIKKNYKTYLVRQSLSSASHARNYHH